MHWHRMPGVLAVALALLACQDRPASRLTAPTIDTLPGGALRIRNHAPTEWPDTLTWSFVEDLRIGGNDTASPLEHPSGVAVDALGRIYVSDGTVKMFDQDGRLVRTVGRDGEGPGEYRSAFLATAGDRLIVQDVSLGRATVFDSAGRFVTSWRTLCCAPAAPSVDAQGNVVIWSPSSESSYLYVRYRQDGSLVDTLRLPSFPAARLWELHTGFGHWSTGIPLTPGAEAAVLPATGMVYGWSGTYTLIATRSGRDTAFLFSLDAPPVTIPEWRRAAATARITTFLEKNGRNIGGVTPDEIARVIHASDVPGVAPAYVGLTTDKAGRLWVERDGGADTLHSRYDIFSGSGTYLGPMIAPVRLARYGRTTWGDSAVYTIAENAEGLPTIVRYRLRRAR